MKTKQSSISPIEAIRHTLAHLLAAAALEFWPEAKLTLGPSIDNGFYYDIDFGEAKVAEEDLPKIEKKMRELLKKWEAFTHEDVSEKEAKKRFAGNPYKLELIGEIAKRGEKITLYTCGGFTDLCRGGHAEHPNKDIDPKAFSLDRLAGAYWRGDEKNQMLTRIYGIAFATKEKLDTYMRTREEAEKREHKKLGRELGLFMFHETAPGSPYWLPKGLILYNELVQFWRKEHTALGYQEIAAPLVNKAELWKTSGHWEHYQEDMFVADMGEHEVYGIKPMNCPNAMIVFQSMQVSYKDLPLRLSDTDRLHRYERSGTLNGLLRCRSFQQDDSHNFISEDMIGKEYKHIFAICKKFYGVFDLEYSFRLGTRPEKFLGEKSTWDKAETTLHEILKASGKPYIIAEGDGAFYGPKVDILMKDCLGRDWQMGTIQLDFQIPARFKLEYTDKDGSKKQPVVVHRVIYGSLERFIGILTEHFAGAFPLWLSPVQAAVVPVSDKFADYGAKVRDALLEQNVRVEMRPADETLGKRIRGAEMMKVPYILVVGEKEAANGSVNVRHYHRGQEGEQKLETLIEIIRKETDEKII